MPIRKKSVNLGWAWKEGSTTRNPAKKKNSKKVSWDLILSKDFYSSKEWRELRYKVIKKFKAVCMACGRSPKKHGIVIHVDHIKPKSKYPHLALVFNNLQILCEDCNVGKSNKDQTNWK